MTETCPLLKLNFECFGRKCGQWECDSYEDGAKCKLKCLQDENEYNGEQVCSCYVQFGPIKILRNDGCRWKIIKMPSCSYSSTTTASTTITTTPTITTSTTGRPVLKCGNEKLHDINGHWYCNTGSDVYNGSICKLKCFYILKLAMNLAHRCL